jgi:hypothetical protein
VLGPWGSGTTAVTGLLSHLGAYTCPPYFITNDPRTKNSFEPAELREILLRHVHVPSLMIVGNRLKLAMDMQVWFKTVLDEGADAPLIAIKLPLLSMLVAETKALVNPHFVLVRRPLADIERTRVRRNWHPVYGILGARALYKEIYCALFDTGSDFLEVAYPELIEQPAAQLERITRFLDLPVTDATRESALSYLRR